MFQRTRHVCPRTPPPATKRTRFTTTPLWLHETNRPSAASLNSPLSPTAKPATPTFDDYVPSPAHDDVRLAPTPIAPQHRPFSLLDMHPHRSHLASPQTPHLAPPPLPAKNALKRTRPDSPPPASPPPQGTLRADGSSAKLLDTHDYCSLNSVLFDSGSYYIVLYRIIPNSIRYNMAGHLE